jgi:hypothetical protein
LNVAAAPLAAERGHTPHAGRSLDQLEPICQHGNAISLLSIGMRFAPDRESEWSLGTRTLTSSMPWWPGMRRRQASSVDGVQGRAGTTTPFSPGPPQFAPHGSNRDRGNRSCHSQLGKTSDGSPMGRVETGSEAAGAVRDRCPPSRGPVWDPERTKPYRASPVSDSRHVTAGARCHWRPPAGDR